MQYGPELSRSGPTRNRPKRTKGGAKRRPRERVCSAPAMDGDKIAGEVYFALCKEVNTPVSLGLWLRYKYGEHRALAEVEFDPRYYLEKDAERLRGDYMAASFLKKFKGLKTGIDTADVAIQGFAASEEKCRATNIRLKNSRLAPIDARLSGYLLSAKRKISDLLGPCSLHAIDPFFGWGPGATYDHPRRRAQVDTKMTAIPITVSGRAKEFLDSVIRQDLHWSSALLGQIPEGPFEFIKGTFETTDFCRVDTVPKSSKTDRVIAIEPTGNLFLQKGIGGYFRRCLKRRGIDLDDQGLNQRRAKNALRDQLATLDLKAASDTVSMELVYELLPLDWAFLIDALRSHTAEMPDGTFVRLNKVSSMGNGFTFELETLIFWALGMSVIDESDSGGALSVYGDDIIVSREHAPELIRLLQFSGFDLNKEKSYVEGLFFESCGRHYFNGHEITPAYQKEVIDQGAELIRTHNRIVRWRYRADDPDPSGYPAARCARRFADPKLAHCVVPHGDEADTGFLSDLGTVLEVATRLDANRGARVWSLMPRTKSLPGDPSALLANKLRLSSTEISDSPHVNPLNKDCVLADEEPQVSRLWKGVNSPDRSDNLTLPLDGACMSYRNRWVVTPGYCLLGRR